MVDTEEMQRLHGLIEKRRKLIQKLRAELADHERAQDADMAAYREAWEKMVKEGK